MNWLRLLNIILSLRGMACTSVAIVILILFGVWRTPVRQFRYYILDPVPKSVADIRWQGDASRMLPEPVCYIRFAASTNDLGLILSAKDFVSVAGSFNPPAGPPWWDVGKLSSPRAFVRQHRPERKSKFPIGKNRGWTESLWIDSTGTNAYFLIWGV